MRAMVLDRPQTPLRLADLPEPSPGAGQVLLKVHCCGVCRTDLHVVDGELTEPKLPLVPGHQIVGTVAVLGEGVTAFKPGQSPPPVSNPILFISDPCAFRCVLGSTPHSPLVSLIIH